MTLIKFKTPGPDGFIGAFNKTFKEEIKPIHKLFERQTKTKKHTEEERTLSNSLYEVSIALIPKPKTLQENYRPDT